MLYENTLYLGPIIYSCLSSTLQPIPSLTISLLGIFQLLFLTFSTYLPPNSMARKEEKRYPGR